MAEKTLLDNEFFDKLFFETVELEQKSEKDNKIILNAALEELQLSMQRHLKMEHFAIHAMRYAQLIELISQSCSSKKAFLEKVWTLEKFAVNSLKTLA